MEGRRVIESLRWPLTPAEIQARGELLARHNQELLRIEGDKKNAAATFKSLEAQEQKAIEQLAAEITQGFVYRDTECVVWLSMPKTGMKQIVRPDTGEIVRTEPMTAEEMQIGIDFDGGKTQ